MRPGCGVMTTTRSESSTASAMLCVTKTTVPRLALRPPDAQQLVTHRGARDLVQGAEGLVHEQQPRRRDQRPRQRDALLHAAGKLVRIVRRETR